MEKIKDADKAKALYRRALGHRGLKDPEAALKDLEEAKKLAPGDGMITKELDAVKAAQAAEIAKAKKVYAKAFE